jgi:hypothetical protein
VHDVARNGVRLIRDTPQYLESRPDRKKVEICSPFEAHQKLDHLRLRGPSGAHEFPLAAARRTFASA